MSEIVNTINLIEDSNDYMKIDNLFDNILDTLSTFRLQITSIQNQIRGLEKTVKKEVKGLKKEVDKNKHRGNRKPSGFAKPSKITKELSEFMNKDNSIEVARTEVTQYLISYIKKNGLTNSENKKIIEPNNTLKNLLDNGEEEVTYFNIQKFMNKHFIK